MPRFPVGIAYLPRHGSNMHKLAQKMHVWRSGSCRDFAVLIIAALRSRGIAARFVSGYVHLADEQDDEDEVVKEDDIAGGQAYVPGRGWVDFDLATGATGNQNLHPRCRRAASGRCDPVARHVGTDPRRTICP